VKGLDGRSRAWRAGDGHSRCYQNELYSQHDRIGDFTRAALPVGNYQMRVENTGFKTEVVNDIVVAAGATVRLDVALELGAPRRSRAVGRSFTSLWTLP